MAVPASTAPAAKAYLVTTITSQVNDPAVLVSYGEPGPNQPNDIISVGRVRRRVEPLAMIGSGQALARWEDYTVEVIVEVFRGVGGIEAVAAVDARAWALVALIETAVRNDPSLGGLVNQAWPTQADSEDGWEADHKGYRSRITVTVDIGAPL